MKTSSFTRTLVATLMGMASLAQAQTASPVTGTNTPQTLMPSSQPDGAASAEAPPAAAKPAPNKPCPFPMGSRIRPHRLADGTCPGVDESEMNTQMQGVVSAAGVLGNGMGSSPAHN